MMRSLTYVSLALSLSLLAACTPRLSPLHGTIAPARLPDSQLAPGHRTIVFRWDLEDQEMSARGDGAARVASPDSARLDFFLAGGMGHGAAVLVGDSLQTPGPDEVRDMIPPPPMLWASLGRMAVPPLPDTAVRVDGAVLRADIGKPVVWRVTFRGDTLTRLDHVSNGHVVEWVERKPGGDVQYRREGTRRSLRLSITRIEPAPSFDASIWHLD